MPHVALPVVVSLLVAVWLPADAAGAADATAVAAQHGGSAWADFDGDGFADLAVGVPGESVGGASAAGAVNVLYGGPNGLTDRDQLWHQDSPGIKGGAERGDFFGGSVAAGDFDGDGFGDLAVGVLGESVGGAAEAGMVNVLYGGAAGLTARDQVWHQNSPGIEDDAEQSDLFGWSVVAGDFDGDNVADLAVGVPGESVGGSDLAGAVSVLYGGPAGLTDRDQLWHQDTPGIEDGAEPGDFFGASVAAGDFDGDGFADLVVGVPDESVGGTDLAGAVGVLYGGPAGLTDRDQLWHQDTPGIKGGAEPGDGFGQSVAAGHFDGDGFSDLAVGVPGESVRGADFAGMVNVLYGGAAGLTARDQVWHQDSPGVKGGAEPFDVFGVSVAAGYFDGDGVADLAVGVPGESVGGADAAGMVNVLYGGAAGLTARDQVWHQDSPGVKGGAEAGDTFGESVAAGDFDGDGVADLAVGVSGESVRGAQEAGMVNVLYGGAAGLTARDQVWHQDSPGIKGGAETNDYFGQAVAGSTTSGPPN